jgi:hypothetical protein
VYDAIKRMDKVSLFKNVNKKELDRVMEDTGLCIDDLLHECSLYDLLSTVLAGRISKRASRQGTRDEETQIQACKETGKKYGINITNLSVTAFRPRKNGDIVCQMDIKHEYVQKDDCLKSFDGRIEGRMKGWIFAKIVYGNGGHQDNVFEEADALCRWVEEYHRDEDDMFVLLINTDLDDKLASIKLKYQDVKNIMVTNHYEFQMYIIENYIAL